MSGRHIVGSLVFVSSVSVSVWGLGSIETPTPPGLAPTELWRPAPLVISKRQDAALPGVTTLAPLPDLPVEPPRMVAISETDTAPEVSAERIIWSRKIAAGETLATLLREGGLSGADRAEVSLALGAEYDLRKLRPGHTVSITISLEGTPLQVGLRIDGGTRIEAIFGDRLATRVVTPEPDIVAKAGSATIESTIFAALEDADMPALFAVNLAQMLGGTIDFRRDLSGGETIELLWREAWLGDEIVRQPEIAFAALQLSDELYEVVWPDDGSGLATIFRNGELLRVFAQPVQGARLSSVYGHRKHPVYGNVRMHTGIDFAAPHGTPVSATAPGRIAFVGQRRGYGRVVEISHGSGTLTRYAHLSAVPDELAVGERIDAGETIGSVGESGTATGPNLHYEVLIDGRPTDPLTDDRLAKAGEKEAHSSAAIARLRDTRVLFQRQLAQTAGAGQPGRT